MVISMCPKMRNFATAEAWHVVLSSHVSTTMRNTATDEIQQISMLLIFPFIIFPSLGLISKVRNLATDEVQQSLSIPVCPSFVLRLNVCENLPQMKLA